MGIQPANIFLIREAASQIVCANRATGLEGRLIEMNGTSWRHAHQRLNPLSQESSLWEKKTLDLDIIAESTSVSLIFDFSPLHSPHCTAPGCYQRSMSALASRSGSNASRASSSFRSKTKEPLNVAALPW
jgi:hypothetical protein